MIIIENAATSAPMHAKRILESHLNIGREKPVSYLPLSTIERVIGIKVSEYTGMIEALGNEFLVFASEECCIKSGAVFAYSYRDLENVLRNHRDVLAHNGWSTDPRDFVRRLASEWLDDRNPILSVIKRAFGEH